MLKVTATGAPILPSESGPAAGSEPIHAADHVVADLGRLGRARSRRSLRPFAPDDECASLRRAQAISRVGSWEYDCVTGILTVSDELLNLYGLDREVLAFGQRALAAAIHPQDLDRTEAAVDLLLRTGEPVSIRYRVIRPRDGVQLWFNARAVSERDDQGVPRLFTCTVTDISELAQAEEELRNAHAELLQAHSFQQAVIATTPDAIHVYDIASGLIERANRSGAPLIGYTEESVSVMAGHALDELMPDADRLVVDAAMTEAEGLPDGEVLKLRHRVLHRDGTTRWLSRRLSAFARNADGDVTQVLLVSRDVTDVVVIEQRLEHAATHDELTGLPNRRFIAERLRSVVEGRGPSRAAVLVCDLDGFKRINDAHGHAAGDAVLSSTAARLTQAIRPGDIVARLGGDEFVVILDAPDGISPQELAEVVAVRIEQELSAPFFFAGQEHIVTVSIGICIPLQETTAGAVLANADAAMYHVKKHGANGHSVFDPQLRAQTRRQDLIERCIRRSLRDDSLAVHFQPIVAPGSGRVHAVEALVRIPDEDGALLDTASVIAVAESTGLVNDIDDRVLRLACDQVALWRRVPEHRDLRLTLNRSAKDITKPGFHDRIMTAISAGALPPDALTIEITETVLLDAETGTLDDLLRLREHGVGLAIDDFGTGYASLRYLTNLPITCIKIDKSFTSKMLEDATCLALVRATVGIAFDLGIDCTVEGVETPEQLSALPQYEQLLVQGFLFGHPRPADEGLVTAAAARHAAL